LKSKEDMVLTKAESLPSTDLEGIFQQVQEVKEPVIRKVEGMVPSSCYGLFCRNGLNAKQRILHDYFLFDGDGMIHSVQMGQGNHCTYSLTCVNTHRLQDENALGGAGHARGGDLKYRVASFIHLVFTAL
jgi:carotenoid cleavage dioxygenase-like enzyme